VKEKYYMTTGGRPITYGEMTLDELRAAWQRASERIEDGKTIHLNIAEEMLKRTPREDPIPAPPPDEEEMRRG
jgi:hypothetical protein